MREKNFLYWKYILLTVIMPAGATFLISTAFCLIEKNYYYLPYELDFLIDISYNALYYFLYFVLFFVIGIVSVTMLKTRVKPIIITSLVGAVSHFVVFPFAAYLARLIFLSSTVDVNAMGDYFFSDLLSGVENGVRFLIATLVALAVKVFFKMKKLSADFKKPYVLPISAPQIALAIFYLAWLLLALVSFIFDEAHDAVSLIIEAILAISGYFISILGVLFAEKRLIKDEIDIKVL